LRVHANRRVAAWALQRRRRLQRRPFQSWAEQRRENEPERRQAGFRFAGAAMAGDEPGVGAAPGCCLGAYLLGDGLRRDRAVAGLRAPRVIETVHGTCNFEVGRGGGSDGVAAGLREEP
jgi:hypothetical protein